MPTGKRLKRTSPSTTSNPFAYRDDTDGLISDVLDSRVGIYGWRKRCLYFFVLLLLLVLIINLALLVWITRVMDFNVDGMGILRIHNDRVSVQGRSEFVQPLYAQSISADVNTSLRLTSNRAINLTAGQTQLYLGTPSISARAENLEVRDSNGTAYFTVTPTRMMANVENILLNSSRGAAFRDFVQTSEIRGEPGQQLRVVSASSRLSLTGAAGVELQASGTGLNVYSPSLVQLQSPTGQLLINASRITLPSLPVVQPPTSTQSPALANVFEVCACQNSGQLFLASPNVDRPCQAAADQCL